MDKEPELTRGDGLENADSYR